MNLLPRAMRGRTMQRGGGAVERVSGLSNWKLTIRREADAVTILRAVTCDADAALPDTLFDLPVTALADRCLAPTALPVEGEAVLVEGGPPGPDWDNRRIRRLTLPEGLTALGDYALMGLAEMEELRLHDALTGLGSAAFMNCRSLTRLTLTRAGTEQGPALAKLAAVLPGELDVRIREPGGETRLLFPAYTESYEENSAAHHFDLRITGAGYPYHSVFREKKLTLSDYDALFPRLLGGEHEADAALRLAWYRLRWPAGLTPRARAVYAAYLAARRLPTLLLPLEEDDRAGLLLALGLGEPGREELDQALQRARELGRTEAVAILLETRRRRFGAGSARRFEL